LAGHPDLGGIELTQLPLFATFRRGANWNPIGRDVVVTVIYPSAYFVPLQSKFAWLTEEELSMEVKPSASERKLALTILLEELIKDHEWASL